MANEIEVGVILDGKVTGITKFGAFVALPGGKSGLVHISEIAYSYVSDVNDFLSEGQDVKVKVINIDENHRINLSIKQAQPRPARPAFNGRPQGDRVDRAGGRAQGDRGSYRSQGDRSGRPQQGAAPRDRSGGPSGDRRAPRSSAPKEPQTFDDMLKQFMSDSDSKLSGRYDRPKGRRGNGRKG